MCPRLPEAAVVEGTGLPGVTLRAGCHAGTLCRSPSKHAAPNQPPPSAGCFGDTSINLAAKPKRFLVPGWKLSRTGRQPRRKRVPGCAAQAGSWRCSRGGCVAVGVLAVSLSPCPCWAALRLPHGSWSPRGMQGAGPALPWLGARRENPQPPSQENTTNLAPRAASTEPLASCIGLTQC